MLKITKGFTLIELMVAVAILALLSAIAIPVYTRYSDRTYRSEAMADLLDCAQGLERRAVRLSTILAQPLVVQTTAPSIRRSASPESAVRYNITIVGGAANFALTATPIGGIDQGRVLTFNSNGQRPWDGNPGWEE